MICGEDTDQDRGVRPHAIAVNARSVESGSAIPLPVEDSTPESADSGNNLPSGQMESALATSALSAF